MKIEHLEERTNDYKASIKKVVEKKTLWNDTVKPLLLKTLKTIVSKYEIGWKVQELSWIHNNEAVNITFDSFPKDLIDCTNRIPSYQFLYGGTLVFSQTYSGDINIFVIFPQVNSISSEDNSIDFGMLSPANISEKIINEKVDEFLKEMINWELPNKRSKVGYSH